MKALLTIFIISMLVLSGCGNTQNTNNTNQNSTDDTADVVYFDVDNISGSYKATNNTPVTWQKSGLIRGDVKVFMDTVHWASDLSDSSTLANRSDLDGDGKDEQITISGDPDNGMSVIITMDGKNINLFSLVSPVFLETASEIPGGNDGSNLENYIDVACIDLDGDKKREILLAFGNDNGAMVLSLLKYTGGDNLYKEVGGIKGTKQLRYFIITTDNKLFAELYFSNPPSDEPKDMNYIEYLYKNGELKENRYRLVSVSGSKTGNSGSKTTSSNNDQGSKGVSSLVGKWASHSYGQLNGQSTSDDELLTLSSNGTFTDVVVTSGPIIKGTLSKKGKYKVSGNIIIFYDCRETWTPAAGSSGSKAAYKDKSVEDYEYEYELEDPDTLSIDYLTFERAE